MSELRLRRRDAVRVTAGVAGVAALGGVASGQSSLADWLSNASNYDGVVDRTGASEVTVRVGVEANGGAFGFGPAAVRVDPGTTVVWEWTGEGGSHNVVAADGDFRSDLVGDAGHTYSRTVEESGVRRYVCEPHATVGMKGAVVVGDAASGAPAATEGESRGGGGNGDGDGDGDGDGNVGAATTPTGTERPADAANASGGADGTDGAGGASSASESGDAGGASGASAAGGLGDAALLVGGGVLGALLSPAAFGALLWATGRGEGPARMDDRGRTYRPGDERRTADGTVADEATRSQET